MMLSLSLEGVYPAIMAGKLEDSNEVEEEGA
jgi:hypothetical protein